MTRFARAKGSKSSNEKKPEEATSWLEMKNAMSTNPVKEQNIITEKIKKTVNHSVQKSEWAPLGEDATSTNIALIKQHNNKLKNEETNLENTNQQKKKRKLKENGNLLNGEGDLSLEGSKEIGNKLKNKKKSASKIDLGKDTPINIEDVKKIKKRKLSEAFEEGVEKKKKKKKDLPDDQIKKNSDKKKKKKIKRIMNNDSEGKSCDGNENKSKTLEKKIKKVKKTVMNSENNKIGKTDQKKISSRSEANGDGYNKKNNFKKFNPRFQNEKFFSQQKNKFKDKNVVDNNFIVDELVINDEKILIVKFQGFNVTLEDAQRLKKLRNDMIKEGIPRDKLEAAIKLERRRAEKALARLKKSVCFNCRGFGHLLSNCPELTEKRDTNTGICYKCGSTEHCAAECKVVKDMSFQYAECFICKEQGHIARQCPDNPRGLYPQGGACRECGDVTHLRKDCPKVIPKKTEEIITLGRRSDRDLECLDEELENKRSKQSNVPVKKNVTVKF